MNRRASFLDSAWRVAGLYVVVTVVMTWPLAPGAARDVPADFGDPVLNMWIVGWHAHQLGRLLAGDLSGLASYWHANIFHPRPFTLAYSEHLWPQALQALPIVALTGNLVLAYNLLFLSTFVLSGLGVYLFLRQATSRPAAAFAGGLLFAFAGFRAGQLGHLQVLSAQWMPFVLWGLRRYFDVGRLRSLAGAAAALVVQNLSCGYYLFFFAPVAGAYAVFELAARRRLGDTRTWRSGPTASAAAAGGSGAVFGRRVELPDGGPPSLRFWGGRLRSHPSPEGDSFPGLIPIGLSAIGVALMGARAWVRGRHAGAPVLPRAWPLRLAAVLCLVSAALHGLGLAMVVDGGPRRLDVAGIEIGL